MLELPDVRSVLSGPRINRTSSPTQIAAPRAISLNIGSHSNAAFSTENESIHPTATPMSATMGRAIGKMDLTSPMMGSPITQSPLNTRPHIDTKNLRAIRGPISAPACISANGSYIKVDPDAYGKWEDRFVNPLLPLIASYIPHLKSLSLSGCHINDWDFSNMLEQLKLLERLDISFSTVKNSGLEGVSRYCRHNLNWLNVSGIFRFGRNKPKTIAAIVQNCIALRTMIVQDCPEIDADEHILEFQELCEGRVDFLH